jgi:hypothetical protein
VPCAVGAHDETTLRTGNIHQGHGVYAHVEHVPDSPFVNIEYTIYYAYNEGGDTHDGDIVTVQVVYDSSADLLERVGYSDHGCYLQVYELDQNLKKSYETLNGTAEDETTPQQLEVARIDISNRGTINSGCVPTKGDATIFFARDPINNRFEHLVVYFERPSRESISTRASSFLMGTDDR